MERPRFDSARVTRNPAPVSSVVSGLTATWQSWLPKVLLITGLTWWIYWPALRGDFIWDDQWYITTNPLVHQANGLWKFWFQPGSWVEYYPIEETVIWIQWHLWGNDTLGYHCTNVFLHIVNALLVWYFLTKFRLRFAWLGGLIFAVHPVQVESVAYISELKNALSLPCFLLAMVAWIDYEESKAKRDYEKALALFLVAMLCKISMAPFAAVILLYAWWKRGRIEWSDVKACLPFLLVAIVLGYLTIWAGNVYESAGLAVIPGTPLGGPLSRIDAAGLNATVYFARCFLPVDVMLVYPEWPLHPHALIQYVPWLVLVAVLGVLWWKRQGWGRHALLGFGFFLIILSPFVGFVPVSYMNFIWVMDHLLYIPIIGLIGLVVAGMEGIDAQISAWSRRLGVGIIVAVVALMAWVSHAFAGLFTNELVFWTHILQRNPTVWLAHDDLGCKLLELERYPEAIAQENEAIKLRPDAWDGYYNIGFALEKLGRAGEAKEQYRHALALNSRSINSYLNLGEIDRREGQIAEAESQFRQGLRIAPDDASLNTDLAGVLSQTGRGVEAIAVYQHILGLNPDLAQIQYDLGDVLLQAGRLSEAQEHLEAAVTLDPKIAAAHENLGTVLAQLGRPADAIDQFQTALQINPSLEAARYNLALALTQTGQIPEAIEQFERVLQLDPANAQARDSLAKLQRYQIQQSAPPDARP